MGDLLTVYVALVVGAVLGFFLCALLQMAKKPAPRPGDEP